MYKKIISLNQSSDTIKDLFFDDESFVVYNNFCTGSHECFLGLTGFYNITTKKIIFGEFTSHQDLAKSKQIGDEISLEGGWYGLNVHESHKTKYLEISPKSGQYGGIPIKCHLAFESLIKKLFSKHFSKILFYQYRYERYVDMNIIKSLAKIFPDNNLVGNVQENEELLNPETVQAIKRKNEADLKSFTQFINNPNTTIEDLLGDLAPKATEDKKEKASSSRLLKRILSFFNFSLINPA
ncbi:hypothetical protein ACFL5G_04835 [Candidatus Margulisiibacteriota bacterium]